MKTESDLKMCANCQTRYSPTHSHDECPHFSRAESEQLRAMRQAGQPYKREVWKEGKVSQ